MGLDLTLMPIEGDSAEWGYAHTQLDCARKDVLFEKIMTLEIPGQCVPASFSTFRSREGGGDSHYGNTQQTPYGEPLLWVHASRLQKLSAHPQVQDNYQNRAVWGYLAALPVDTKIALFWH